MPVVPEFQLSFFKALAGDYSPASPGKYHTFSELGSRKSQFEGVDKMRFCQRCLARSEGTAPCQCPPCLSGFGQ